MKKISTLLVCLMAATSMFAQSHGPMKFAGPANYSNTAFGVNVNNESDTIVFSMKGMTAGDITLPSLNYAAMNMTIPSFTIADAAFTFDMQTMTATFTPADYSTTVTVGDQEKTISGQITEAVYCGSAGHTFKLTCTIKYGNMPLVLTYTIDAIYVPEETSLSKVGLKAAKGPIYDLTGKQVAEPVAGRIYFQNGKKFICR